MRISAPTNWFFAAAVPAIFMRTDQRNQASIFGIALC
jgi:hypothetical protein